MDYDSLKGWREANLKRQQGECEWDDTAEAIRAYMRREKEREMEGREQGNVYDDAERDL